MYRMKKLFIICLSLWIAAFFAGPSLFAIPASDSGGIGDANSDNDVNIIDALMIAQYYVGLNPSPFYPAKGDINGDGVIDIIDALKVAQYYVGLITIGSTPLPTPTPQPTPAAEVFPGEYRIIFKHSGLAVSVAPGETGNSANIIQNGITAADGNQIWSLTAVSAGYYRITNKGSGLVMEVADSSLDNGANIQQWSNWGGENQQWTLTQAAGGYYLIQNRLSGKYLDASGKSVTPGANVIQWQNTGGDNQLCRLERVLTETPSPLKNITIYIAGDSTVQTYTASATHQAGWGQMLPEFLKPLATVNNKAIGGRTARRFIDEGRLNDIWSTIRPGDYLLVQFGTNDGNRTATYTLNGQTIPYYLDPQTDFKYYLRQYITGARSRGAILIFVTPPPRSSAYCTGANGTSAHSQAMRELGIEENVPVADLNTMSVNYLKAICPAPQPENFFLLRTDGTVDGTHFQENGARILARLITDSIRTQGLPLAGYLKN